MFFKMHALSPDRDSSTAETQADLFFEIGKDQIGRMHPTEAIKWLTKAFEAISGQNLDELTSDAPELQVSIMHSMVKALIALGGDKDIARAWNIVQDLDIRYSDKLAVLLLKLDLYALNPIFPPQDYCDVLQRIVRTVHLTNTNIKTALHHVQKLRARNTRMAHTVLVALATERLLGVEDFDWLEKTLITTVWNCTTSAELEDAINLLSDFLNTLHTELGKAISPSATHAAQIVRFYITRLETFVNARNTHSAYSCCADVSMPAITKDCMRTPKAGVRFPCIRSLQAQGRSIQESYKGASPSLPVEPGIS